MTALEHIFPRAVTQERNSAPTAQLTIVREGTDTGIDGSHRTSPSVLPSKIESRNGMFAPRFLVFGEIDAMFDVMRVPQFSDRCMIKN